MSSGCRGVWWPPSWPPSPCCGSSRWKAATCRRSSAARRASSTSCSTTGGTCSASPAPDPLNASKPRSAIVGAVLIGAAAGLIAAAFLTVSAEPSIEEAIRIEHAHAVAAGEQGGGADEIVSRDVQKGVGLFSAYALAGAGFGLLFGAGFVLARRAWPDRFRRAVVCGAMLAGALTVSPWIKYPPNPPAVGDPATLSRRQVLYVSVIVLTFLVLAGAAWLAVRLRRAGWPEPRRAVAVAACVAVALLAVYAALPPAPDAVNAPATLVWRFRLASLGGNLALWMVLSLGFGLVAAER